MFLPAQKRKIKFDESFDPSTLNEPKIKLPIILRPDEPLPPEFLPAEGDTVVEGFRVQVISTQNLEQANRLFAQLSPLFEGDVYIIFDSPNYKVRVGNFLSRSTAEEARKRISALGYKAAWIIRTQIKRLSSSRRP
tara:strand:- start:12437 stop:12844 length:408 start_codon:yes stop_codon:yes gene_type:complete